MVNSYGYHTNYDGDGNVLSSYTALLGNASSPPYYADQATFEAIVLGGTRSVLGMPSFAKDLSAAQARLIQAYVVNQARQASR